MTQMRTIEGVLKKLTYLVFFIFIAISVAFLYVEKNEKQTIYNYILNAKIKKHKQQIKLETYAAISFIDAQTKTIMHDEFVKLGYAIRLASTISNHDRNPIQKLKDIGFENGYRLAVFYKDGSSNIDFLNLNYCKPYKSDLNFVSIHFFICSSPSIKVNNQPQKFLLATTKLRQLDLEVGAYKPMLEVEQKIMDVVFKKINDFILADKNSDSYFFIAKILNINGGDAFAMNIFNKSRGITIGKPASSHKPDAMGNYYREKYLKALKEKGQTYSVYYYPSPTSSKPRKKISFRMLYKPLNWMVGTGFYVDNLKKNAALMADEISKKLKLFNLLLLGVFILSIFLINGAGSALSKRISEDASKIISGLKKLGKTETPIKLQSIEFDKFRKIAEAINLASTQIINKNNQIERNRVEFIETFVKVVEARDVYTKGHSERVAYYAKKIGEMLGLDEKRQHNLYISGLLHDLGKVAIPDAILLKPGKLSEHEYEIMKLHPLFSYLLVKDISMFKDIAIFVKQHHERCDGKGYPDGLSCKDITLEGKILAIADVFDALTTSRPYRAAFSIQKAITIMKESALDNQILAQIEDALPRLLLIENDQPQTTDILKQIEQSRMELFEKDLFSGLYRIKAFLDFIGELIKRKRDYYIFMVDIKKLKRINFLLGYEAGNRLILEVAKLIRDLENTSFHARIGANFFGFVYKGSNPEEMAKIIKDRLSQIEIEGQHFEYYVSFISLDEAQSAEEAVYLLEEKIEQIKYHS
ncbi:HD domain-containing phosphohydrolase [Hippea jasoniae]|uniref:HD domain-containing phosphohydrolase n=1 Tax=Hippea jasoniae TaxID=944479 RepID=UPI000A059AFD|nr:HD domain-containing phosphohydrolase [Hippea jasoniae]